jgi:hypothetical protein
MIIIIFWQSTFLNANICGFAYNFSARNNSLICAEIYIINKYSNKRKYIFIKIRGAPGKGTALHPICGNGQYFYIFLFFNMQSMHLLFVRRNSRTMHIMPHRNGDFIINLLYIWCWSIWDVLGSEASLFSENRLGENWPILKHLSKLVLVLFK